MTVSRDAALNTTLRDFSLIAPEMRLTGRGTALHKPGASLLDDPLAIEFKLRARGRQGALLKYLGAIEPQPSAEPLAPATGTIGGSFWLALGEGGRIQLQGKHFTAVEDSLRAHLLIDAESLDEVVESRTVLPGVRLPSR